MLVNMRMKNRESFILTNKANPNLKLFAEKQDIINILKKDPDERSLKNIN